MPTGQALARLSNGTDVSNRTITVTASAGSASGTVDVDVINTQVIIGCPDTIALAASGPCNVRVQDSKAAGIAESARHRHFQPEQHAVSGFRRDTARLR